MSHPYITVEELKNDISEKILIQLSDDTTPPTTMNESLVISHLNKASSKIDDYLRQAYGDKLPFNTPSENIKAMTADIAIYRLYKRRMDPPTDVVTSYNNTIALLKEMGQDRNVEDAEGIGGKPSLQSFYDETDTEYAETETFTVQKILEQ